MKKSKQNKTQKNNNNVDSNEIARQIAIETIKDTEKFFQRIANFFKGIWKFLTTPGMISSFKNWTTFTKVFFEMKS